MRTTAVAAQPCTEVATTETAAIEAAPVAQATAAHEAATALAQPAAAKAVATQLLAAKTAMAPELQKLTRAERKDLKQQLKKQIASPQGIKAEGKSQLVAVLLCFFLGGLGIHDFYMGKVGKGILQIILSILVVGFILVIIDFVRLLTGDLKPKDGDWAKKL